RPRSPPPAAPAAAAAPRVPGLPPPGRPGPAAQRPARSAGPRPRARRRRRPPGRRLASRLTGRPPAFRWAAVASWTLHCPSRAGSLVIVPVTDVSRCTSGHGRISSRPAPEQLGGHLAAEALGLARRPAGPSPPPPL